MQMTAAARTRAAFRIVLVSGTTSPIFHPKLARAAQTMSLRSQFPDIGNGSMVDESRNTNGRINCNNSGPAPTACPTTGTEQFSDFRASFNVAPRSR